MTEQQEIEQILERNRNLIEALKNLTNRIRGEEQRIRGNGVNPHKEEEIQEPDEGENEHHHSATGQRLEPDND